MAYSPIHRDVTHKDAVKSLDEITAHVRAIDRVAIGTSRNSLDFKPLTRPRAGRSWTLIWVWTHGQRQRPTKPLTTCKPGRIQSEQRVVRAFVVEAVEKVSLDLRHPTVLRLNS